MRYQAYLPAGGEFAAKLIEAKVQSLSGLTGRWHFDPDDVRQELWSDLAKKWPSFNPKRGTEHAFIRSVVYSRVAKLLEYAKAQCRDYRLLAASLDEPLDDEDGHASSIGALLDLEDLLPLVGEGSPATWDCRDLRVDLASAMAALSPKEAALCNDLLSLKISEISELRGIPPASIHDMLRRIQTKLTPILGNYFKQPPTNCRRFR